MTGSYINEVHAIQPCPFKYVCQRDMSAKTKNSSIYFWSHDLPDAFEICVKQLEQATKLHRL